MLHGNLLDDTIILILTRLPTYSLVRFKFVSKPWRQLIESPQFITEHYQTRATVGNNSCLLIKMKRRNHFSFIYNHSSSWRGLKDLHQSKDSYTNFPPCKGLRDLHQSKNSYTIFPPCNGIFCVLIDHYTVQLWNPSIRQYKTLPRSLIPDFEPPHTFSCTYDRLLGLTFDPNSNVYKVVRIWVFARGLNSTRKKSSEDYMNKVEVWAPGNDSWRQIDAVPHFPLRNYDDPINLKGKCYWLVGYFSNAIVSFDMVSESFHATLLPCSLCVKSIDYKRMRVSVLNESIAVFSNPLQHNPEHFEVWLMNGSEQESWSRYMTVEMPLPGSIPIHWRNIYRNEKQPMMFPLAFWNSRELIFCDKFKRLVFLNTSTGKITHSWLRIDAKHLIYVYNESLVSINDW